jgi:hypothetical protein
MNPDVQRWKLKVTEYLITEGKNDHTRYSEAKFLQLKAKFKHFLSTASQRTLK